MMPPLILASTSKYRAQLLDRLGLNYTAVSPLYVEQNDLGLPPEQLVIEQARGKAESLVSQFDSALIIGSDQVAVLGDAILTKPGGHDQAFLQLKNMAGREHQLMTALVVVDARSGQSQEHLHLTRIAIRDLDDDEIHHYLNQDKPYDCAGSYMAECSAPWIFEYQRGDDPTAVIGLPLIALGQILRKFSDSKGLQDE